MHIKCHVSTHALAKVHARFYKGRRDAERGLQGLLKIRGEVKKSDTVATLLACKAIQNMVLEAGRWLQIPTTKTNKMNITFLLAQDKSILLVMG